MTFDFISLYKLFREWETVTLEQAKEVLEVSENNLYCRLNKIILNFKTKGSLENKPDFMVLVRQILTEQKAKNEINSELSVPTADNWPEKSDWENFGLQVVRDGSFYKIEPKSWLPEWLKGPKEQSDIHLALLKPRPSELPINHLTTPPKCEMDPFLKHATGYEFYTNSAQREAVRSMFVMPHGSTLIVNIPTGTGKTLLAQANFLFQSGNTRPLTLVIIPTTSLAIDLERRIKELLQANNQKQWKNHTFAWYGGIKEAAQNNIKKKIRNGTQGLLFVSPESAVHALSPSLFDACKRGLFQNFIIDEAHMICAWGDHFRCDFQLLPGFRKSLLKHCKTEKKFRTILMSATFTPSNLTVLEQLFGGPNETLQSLSVVSLRREPTYWSSFCNTESDKELKIFETLRRVPRPYILYMTEKTDARAYFNKLKKKYNRIALFTGDTKPEERNQIINKWQQNEIDGIVATSAFGLGVDKSDIRTIVHGTLPETLDRFYQEVGRGGRDGKPSASVTIYCWNDIKKAKNLLSGGTIGSDKAYEYWRAMWSNKKEVKDARNLWAVNYTTVPKHLRQQGEKMKEWSLTVLTSMSRGKLIEINFSPFDHVQKNEGEEEEAFEIRQEKLWKEYKNSVFIEIKEQDHLDKEYFSQKLREVWKNESEEANHSLELLQKALDGKAEMGTVLSNLYTDRSREIFVKSECRGCPGELLTGSHGIFRSPVIIPIKTLETPFIRTKNWDNYFGEENSECYIFFKTDEKNTEKVSRAIGKLVQDFGFIRLSFYGKDFMRQIQGEYKNKIVFFDDVSPKSQTNNGSPLQLPTVEIFYPSDSYQPSNLSAGDNEAKKIFIVSDKTKSKSSHRHLIDEVPTDYKRLEEFLTWQS